MIKVFAVTFILSMGTMLALASEASNRDLKLELSVSGPVLRVVLSNESQHGISVSARFAYGDKSSPAELNFEIRDSRERVAAYLPVANLRPVSKDGWSFLAPHNLVGHEFPLENIIENYGLGKGKYTISAKYRSDPWGKNGIELTSKPISFVSGTDTLDKLCNHPELFDRPALNNFNQLLKFCLPQEKGSRL